MLDKPLSPFYLMPFPGSQAMPETGHIGGDAVITPVPMVRFAVSILLESLMWMPSVFGLSAGAEMLRCRTATDKIAPLYANVKAPPLLSTRVRLRWLYFLS